MLQKGGHKERYSISQKCGSEYSSCDSRRYLTTRLNARCIFNSFIIDFLVRNCDSLLSTFDSQL